MEDEYGVPVPWVYEATITDPTGLRVTVTVTVPPRAAWGDRTLESAEIAQMNAAHCMTQLAAIRKTEQERPPF